MFRYVAHIAFLSLLGITFLATFFVHRMADEAEHAYFHVLVKDTENELRTRLKNYEKALWSAIGLFKASDYVSRNEWRNFVRAINLSHNLPGVQGLGYIDAVHESDLPLYLEKVRQERPGGFNVHPDTGSEVRYIVKYFEQSEGNGNLLGQDIKFEKHRREAAEKARDLGKAALTEIVLLEEDRKEVPGFLMLAPLYKTASPPETVEARRANHLGWVFAALAGEEFLQNFDLSTRKNVAYRIYSDSIRTSENLIYDNTPLKDGLRKNPHFHEAKLLLVNETTVWGVEWVHADPEVELHFHSETGVVLVSGGLISFVLFALLNVCTKRREQVRVAVEEKNWELKAAYEEQKLLANSIPAFVMLIDNEERYLLINDFFEDYVGMYRSEVIGKKISDLMPKEEYRLLAPKVKEVLAGNHVSFEHSMRKEGEEKLRVFRAQYVPRFDTDGLVTGFFAVVFDISDMKDQERALRESQRRFELAVDGSSDGIWDWHLHNDEVYYSPRLLQQLGYSSDEFPPIFESLKKVVHSKDRAAFTEAIECHLRDHMPFDIELRLKVKSGEYQFFRMKGKALRDYMGIASRMAGSLTDITEQKSQEEKLIEAQRKAELANKAKSDFLTNMSHEIRTPMNAIIGAASLMKGWSKDEKMQRYINTIIDSGDQLLVIINDVLDLSKIEARKLKIVSQPFHVREGMDSVYSMFEPQVKKKGLEYKLQIEPDVPTYLRADVGRLRQIISNLLSNAIKFTEKGTITCKVELLDLSDDIASVKISVIDTGVGISERDQEKLFEKFTQFAAVNDPSQAGTGLGLAISLRLAEIMGGHLGVESQKGKGSHFYVTLKLPVATEYENDNFHDELSSDEDEKYDGRVLLAEDLPTNQMIIGDMLEEFGIEVDCVNNGQEAVNMNVAKDYDLILMDLQMPIMHGLEASRLIREHQKKTGRTVPIVVLSAHALEHHRIECEQAGMDGFLTKPLKKESLANMLKKFLQVSPNSNKREVGSSVEESKEAKKPTLLDTSYIESVRARKPEKAAKLIAMTIDDISTRLNAMVEAIEKEDMETVSEMAHAMKSVSAQIGALLFSNQCREMESLAADSAIQQAKELAEAMQHSFESITMLLQQYC